MNAMKTFNLNLEFRPWGEIKHNYDYIVNDKDAGYAHRPISAMRLYKSRKVWKNDTCNRIEHGAIFLNPFKKGEFRFHTNFGSEPLELTDDMLIAVYEI